MSYHALMGAIGRRLQSPPDPDSDTLRSKFKQTLPPPVGKDLNRDMRHSEQNSSMRCASGHRLANRPCVNGRQPTATEYTDVSRVIQIFQGPSIPPGLRLGGAFYRPKSERPTLPALGLFAWLSLLGHWSEAHSFCRASGHNGMRENRHVSRMQLDRTLRPANFTRSYSHEFAHQQALAG